MGSRTAAGRCLRLALLGVALGACGEPSALDIVLVADPALSTEQSVASSLGRIVVTVDAPDGVYRESAPASAGMRIEDLDADGELELRFELVVSRRSTLPRIRLERGGLPEAGLELRIDGYPTDGDQSVAGGGAKGVGFADGTVRSVTVPFNLRPEVLPPIVTSVFPEDGAHDLAVKDLSSVVVIFSKTMDHSALLSAGVLRLIQESVPVGKGEKQDLEVNVSIRVEDLYPGGPTKAELDLPEFKYSASYRLEVSTGAVDAAKHQSLDQDPAAAGPQLFVSRFATQDQSSCIGPREGCSVVPGPPPNWCSQGGADCTKGLTCDPASRRCQSTTCPTTCPTSMVCDAQHGACVADCRPYGTYGGCTDPGTFCGADGLCALPD